MRTLSAPEARRIALAAQGFCDPRPRLGGRVDTRHFRRVMARMGIVQLDSVNVLCRSHYLPFFARLGAYDRARLDAWLWRSGENVECLAHEATVAPKEVHAWLGYRTNLARWKSGRRFRDEERDYLRAILARVRDEGPLSVRGIDDAGSRSGSWWGWPKGKMALEVLHRSGELSVANRDAAFVTHYDLPERVVGAELADAPKLSADAARKAMLLRAARSLGVATDKDLADYFREKVTRCRPILRELVDAGELESAEVEGWDATAYLAPGARRPRTIRARALLSPFDPVVWCRPRALRLFGFHYRIEIYVPAAKRRFGYYVLPFLVGDDLVARVDLKADRKTRELRVRGAYLEAGEDAASVAAALASTLKEMAEWLGLAGVVVAPKGKLAEPLRDALRG